MVTHNLLVLTRPFQAFQISDLLSYTGYVVELDKINVRSGGVGKDEVIVSSGSGAVGELILETAIRVRPHTTYLIQPGDYWPATIWIQRSLRKLRI